MGFIIGFIKSILGICETRQLNPELWNLENNRIRIKLGDVPELSQEGGAVYLKGKGLQNPVLVVKAQNDSYLAFINACPHAKRKIDPVPGKTLLRCCSLMHSTFDYEGRKISGPANGSLTGYGVELQEGDLIVTM